MGCFTSICGVSGLPIEDGDKVRFFMVTMGPYDNNGRASIISGVWFPRTFPLKGTYCDACDPHWVLRDVEENTESQLWLDGLQYDLIERGIEISSTHSFHVRKDMNFYELLDALSHNCILVDREANLHELNRVNSFDEPMKHVPGKFSDCPLPVGLVIIREDVWNVLLSMKANRNEKGVFENLSFQKYLKRAIKAFSPEELDQRILEWRTEGSIGRFIMGPYQHMILMRQKGYLSEQIVNTIAEFYFVKNILAQLRLNWCLPNTSCSQFTEWEPHSVFHSAIARIARKAFKAERELDT